MLAGLLGVCVGTLLSVGLQHFNIHTRPLLDVTLPLQNVSPIWVAAVRGRTSSFPSDTATLFFGLSMVVFLENRLIGVFCFLSTTAIIAIPRIIFGWHSPSDILGAAILGPGCVFFLRENFLLANFNRTHAQLI